MQSGELDRDEMEAGEGLFARQMFISSAAQSQKDERRVTWPPLPGWAVTGITSAGVSLFPSSAAWSQLSPPASKQPNISPCKWACECLWLTTASQVPTVGTKMPTNSSPWRQKWCWASRRGNCGSPHRRAAKVLMRMQHFAALDILSLEAVFQTLLLIAAAPLSSSLSFIFRGNMWFPPH